MIAPPHPQAIRRAHERGHAICPGCGLEHPVAGWEHMDNGPWRVTPRCIECGTPLRMPQINNVRGATWQEA